ncbi:MAG: hypothetical protein AB1498_08515 [bacterium]
MKNEKTKSKKTAEKTNQKTKKGSKYTCDSCGMVITVNDPCGCDPCDLVCCGQDMRFMSC